MKIIVFESDERLVESFGGLASEHDVRFCEETLSAENAGDHADAEVVSPFTYSTLDAEVLVRLSELQMIATRSTGYDHIDMERCAERDIMVSNVPAYGQNTVAEHVFALLLAVSHNIVEAANRVQRGEFSAAGLQGFDLAGRTMGVIGTGAIGRHTVRIATGFKMDVLAFDIAPDEELAGRLGFRYVAMDELLAQSDVVSLHVPGGESTHHLLSAPQFGAMKEGVIVINTSRGEVIDSPALLEALSSGKVAAAGLDVLEEEPAIREEAELLSAVFDREHDPRAILTQCAFVRLRNVLITPHSAFHTREAVQEIIDTTIENIRGFASGHPQNVVS
ncbi:MAG: hydroxyacid dehydrogenase [Thermoleophilia bacterium]|nr:hydroxyacid dehydrogenase [Thermoleophilia bacterium]